MHHLSDRWLDLVLVEVGRNELSFETIIFTAPAQKSGLTGGVNEEERVIKDFDLVNREAKVELLVDLHLLLAVGVLLEAGFETPDEHLVFFTDS